MKICAVQARPVKGNIQANIENHKSLIDWALSHGAEIIVFPELSLTGYEPELSKELATTVHDSRLDVFQNISDARQIMIGAGLPTKSDAGTCISMVIFQPHQARRLYSKKFLHADEEAFFVSGQNISDFAGNHPIAMAICYELSIPEHPENASKNGAKVYIASVAKSASGVERAAETLAGIAVKFGMTVLMANSVGYCDNFESAGKTSAWNSNGVLAAQLDDTNEGILIIDTDTQEIIEKTIKSLQFNIHTK